MNLTCIICPMGCELTISDDADQMVTGHHCPRGVRYARDEVTNPKRVYTGSVICLEGVLPVQSFKTELMQKSDLPHLKKLLRELKVVAPIHLGDVLYHDEHLTMIATRTVERK